jgi:hypothetical protein
VNMRIVCINCPLNLKRQVLCVLVKLNIFTKYSTSAFPRLKQDGSPCSSKDLKCMNVYCIKIHDSHKTKLNSMV